MCVLLFVFAVTEGIPKEETLLQLAVDCDLFFFLLFCALSDLVY